MLGSLASHAFRGVLVAIALVTSAPAFGEPTDLDPSFGVGGVARLTSDVWLQRAAIYPDGRLAVLVGDRAAPYAQSVVRFDAAGRVDSSFARVRALPSDFWIESIAVTSTGHLVMLQNYLQTPTGETRVTRHLDNGALDPAFGDAGNALVSSFPYRAHSHLGEFGELSRGLAVEPSGRLYSATWLNSSPLVTWITRIGAPGSPVAQLNRTDMAVTRLYYGALRADIDGVVVSLLQGYTTLLLGGTQASGPALIRLVDGVPDPRFGNNGVAFHPLADFAGYSRPDRSGFASTPDGGYVVVGQARRPEGDVRIVAVKFTAAGVLDATFGEFGVAFLGLAGSGEFVAKSTMAVQPNGRIVVASALQVEGTAAHIGLARLTADGKPDTTFAPAGIARVWVDRHTQANFVFVRPNGRIVVVGQDSTGAPAVFQFLGGDAARSRRLGEGRAVEYFHAGQGHYFITARVSEIATLDASSASGWARTGLTFRVWDDDDPSLSPVCRFWSAQSFAPRSSHFYTPYEAECSLLTAGTTWQLEGSTFDVRLPVGSPGARVCPADSQPLYRAYNNGISGAPNHRYTIDARVLDEMVARGWTMEGEARTSVFACVPTDE